MGKAGKSESLSLFERLGKLKSTEASGVGWGYDFPWASPVKYLSEWSPTIVVTGFVAQGIHALYARTEDESALQMLEDISTFMLSLPRTETERGLCFSYSTEMQDICFPTPVC